MDNASGVRGIERVSNLDPHLQQRLQFHAAGPDLVPEGRAVQILHGDEGLSLFLADVVYGADVGMVQCGSSLGFALEAGEGLGVSGDVVGQKLEGNKAVQPGVFGFIDHTHAAATDLLDNAVVRDGPTDHWRTMLLV